MKSYTFFRYEDGEFNVDEPIVGTGCPDFNDPEVLLDESKKPGIPLELAPKTFGAESTEGEARLSLIDSLKAGFSILLRAVTCNEVYSHFSEADERKGNKLTTNELANKSLSSMAGDSVGSFAWEKIKETWREFVDNHFPDGVSFRSTHVHRKSEIAMLLPELVLAHLVYDKEGNRLLGLYVEGDARIEENNFAQVRRDAIEAKAEEDFDAASLGSWSFEMRGNSHPELRIVLKPDDGPSLGDIPSKRPAYKKALIRKGKEWLNENENERREAILSDIWRRITEAPDGDIRVNSGGTVALRFFKHEGRIWNVKFGDLNVKNDSWNKPLSPDHYYAKTCWTRFMAELELREVKGLNTSSRWEYDERPSGNERFSSPVEAEHDCSHDKRMVRACVDVRLDVLRNGNEYLDEIIHRTNDGPIRPEVVGYVPNQDELFVVDRRFVFETAVISPNGKKVYLGYKTGGPITEIEVE
ncbi:hypothetical protein HOD30_05380 [Candidatus Peregrinibacteria bacterium]|jgi:hypothetical protein|nr:hypothetical protein [Candidatus Peregrinibacteria bacterium]MBT4631453.1 hypothetical protein [Candidatus Peregrinibacteria bacterium]MBT5516898.1 hypothetical protein [Candidatus Peregrinibacteria bacterium]MBT5823842.1 hypothetical protein [Candidatus Peregrinibacteria bacterium]